MDQELQRKITSFINGIGISCVEGALPGDTFLPGVDIRDGGIIYDPAKLEHPGDLLHEAGHIAVLLPNDRAKAQSPDQLFGDISEASAEMAAIAWSWAALKYLDIAPEVVFHEEGYKGGSENIIIGFSEERYFGVPMLDWFGMTADPRSKAPIVDEVYPVMKYWLRPEIA